MRKKLTILHSNDLHGDFTPQMVDGVQTGGVARLSGYIEKTRKEEENVIYTISGDMFRGSLIDSEYKGISTIEILNMLSPDAVTLGNHEVDYGIAHLLFLEKCAQFPIINANMFLTKNDVRLFNSHTVIEVGGMRILFIGVLTDLVLAQTKMDKLIGSFIDVREPLNEIGKICAQYKDENIDLTVLLTHIGIEADKELAQKLLPEWKIALIIGGHSHTVMEQPVISANIPIVQAAYGTDRVGRLDAIVDTDTGEITEYEWSLVTINKDCPENLKLSELVAEYEEETDKKYGRVITHFAECYTHPVRNEETTLGRVIADAYKDILKVDIMFLGSGSIRADELGPVVKYRDLIQVLPFNDDIYRIFVTGRQLRRMIMHMLRDEAFEGHTEFYQFSEGFYVEYSREKHEITAFMLDGENISDDREYRIGIQAFHLENISEFLNVSEKEISSKNPPKVISTCGTDILEEYFRTKELVCASDVRRLKII